MRLGVAGLFLGIGKVLESGEGRPQKVLGEDRRRQATSGRDGEALGAF